MPDDLLYLSAQLEIEHNRLRSFTAAAGLTNDEDSLPRTIRERAPLILPILSEIKIVLSKFGGEEKELQTPLEIATSPSAATSQPADSHEALRTATLQLPISTLKQNADTGLKSMLKWSLAEKSQLTEWLVRLRHLNDSLHDLLDENQLHLLRDEQRQTYMELIQMRNSVNDLKALAEAAYLSRQESTARSRWQQTQNTELGDLASFKAFYTTLLDETSKNRTSLLIPASQIQLQDEPSSENVHQLAQFVDSDQTSKEVWLTWHHQQPSNIRSSNSQLSLIEELTALLKARKPDEFRIPPCLGYCILSNDQSQRAKVAVVSQRPQHISNDIRPINLLQAMKQLPRPSLSQRVALSQNIAKCLLYLHSVNWLHKAIRSEVILLFQLDDSNLQLSEPYLTGFDFSRRARWDESSAPKPKFGRMEAYLHPDAQFNKPPQYYRKTFDIYSFGIVLIEIAYWKPIVSIMDIENDIDRSPLSTSTIRPRLLDSEPSLLAGVRAEAGDKFAAAVKTCIEGGDAYGIHWTDHETSAGTSVKIQHGFNSQVVKILDEIVV